MARSKGLSRAACCFKDLSTVLKCKLDRLDLWACLEKLFFEARAFLPRTLSEAYGEDGTLPFLIQFLFYFQRSPKVSPNLVLLSVL